MKKIYNFLALMLLFVAGSLSAVAAERDWTVWDVAESQIETPQNGMFVVLQQGGNKAGWSSNGYLNPSGSFKAAVDASCVYELVKVGEDAQGDNVFVLKNFSNKQYMYSGGHTLSYGEAFQCTILKGEAGSTDLRRLIDGNEKQPDSEGNDWVLAGKLPEMVKNLITSAIGAAQLTRITATPTTGESMKPLLISQQLTRNWRPSTTKSSRMVSLISNLL